MARVCWLLIGLILAGLSACAPPPPPKAPPPPKVSPKEKKPPKPREDFQNLEYVFYEEGRPRWRIEAEKAVRTAGRIEMHHPRVISLQKKGLSVKARRGVYEEALGRLVFEREVVLATPDRGTLYTERLSYLPRRGLLKSRAPVLLKDRGLTIRGRGFEYRLEDGFLRIEKGSRVEFHG
ncbi:LPS export ABC transporter periplasmic protein LptC [Thermosulfurimonas marina]|uniref:LPS export ABC transporter periplasmic protein LptC n=1 Tax=Thermosulfurimonas marina TaxID=2047767 RepID=A0A6H1WUV1_9BACT|nr:LPS export ABC transporter periplasmic protein LptC [Thermosulfurimonas marina]QJA06934.1 LPS export ABC transporter periplasmic protein LptC [Thermosulfurimonas marina]